LASYTIQSSQSQPVIAQNFSVSWGVNWEGRSLYRDQRGERIESACAEPAECPKWPTIFCALSTHPDPVRKYRRVYIPSRGRPLTATDSNDDRGGPHDDVAFFKQNPERRYRVRLATPYEIGKAPLGELPLDEFWCALVHRESPDTHVCCFFGVPAGRIALKPFSEDEAREAFKNCDPRGWRSWSG
jgi:hypothetical protein